MKDENRSFEGLTGLVVAGTGHRPHKLGGYSADVEKRLLHLAITAFTHYQPRLVISGMALGWDMALAQAAAEMNIPFIAAVPFAGQEKRWPPSTQARYHALLGQAQSVEVISPGGYSPAAMQRRNEWMIDRCELALALWDGTSGGTGNCIQYANQVGRHVRNLWKAWQKLNSQR